MKQLITALTDALKSDNTAAIRALGREYGQTSEQLTFALLEATALIYASGKQPRSELYSALMTLGRELDSEAIAWAIQERTRREERAEIAKELKSAWR